MGWAARFFSGFGRALGLPGLSLGHVQCLPAPGLCLRGVFTALVVSLLWFLGLGSAVGGVRPLGCFFLARGRISGWGVDLASAEVGFLAPGWASWHPPGEVFSW